MAQNTSSCTLSFDSCGNSMVIPERIQSQYVFQGSGGLGPQDLPVKDGFVENQNGLIRRWTSWWGPAPGISLIL